MREVHYFEAFDGKQFLSSQQCEEYEVRKAKDREQIHAYGVDAERFNIVEDEYKDWYAFIVLDEESKEKLEGLLNYPIESESDAEYPQFYYLTESLCEEVLFEYWTEEMMEKIHSLLELRFQIKEDMSHD